MSNFKKKNLDIENDESQRDETIKEIKMTKEAPQTNNKEENDKTSETKTTQTKNSEKTKEKKTLDAENTIERTDTTMKTGGEHYIYSIQLFLEPEYKIKQMSTIEGRDQQNSQAKMVFKNNSNQVLLNELSEKVWGQQYDDFNVYMRNAHITHVYCFTEKDKQKPNGF